MGRSVSYPSAATVVTFRDNSGETCDECNGKGTIDCGQCEGTGETQTQMAMMGGDPDETEECPVCDGSGTIECEECNGTGHIDGDDFDMLIDDFRDQLRVLFPSVVSADHWIDREDHVLAENRLAYFGMSKYCGLVAYWIVPKGYHSGDEQIEALATSWVRKAADKFVAAFGELSKVGSMSNGEGVYRRIDK